MQYKHSHEHCGWNEKLPISTLGSSVGSSDAEIFLLVGHTTCIERNVSTTPRNLKIED